MRKIPFTTGEFYHVYNRGVEKRNIFQNKDDLARFFQSIQQFNTRNPIGSIYENSFRKEKTLGHEVSKLVNFVCYSTSLNHYHFILEQLADKGVEKFMHRLGNGYTKYFNHKYKRSGVLFQGVFQSKHISSNEYLLHLSVYINLNNRIHGRNCNILSGLGHEVSKSSWEEYTNDCEIELCHNKNVILGQFKNKKEYKEFAEKFVKGIVERKEDLKKLENYIIE
jgi:REP element-mobilizing transposase RayT